MAQQRQRASWGCVQRVAPGKWRLRWVEGGRRRSETLYGTRREADDRMAQIRVGVGSEPRSRMTVGQAHDRWYLPALEGRVADGSMTRGTLTRRECGWNAHAAPRWADVPLAGVRPLDVQEWLLTLPESVARNCLTVCRDVANLAVMYEVVAANPFSADYRLPKAVRRRDAGTWDLDGLREVWGCVAGTPAEAPFLLMAFGSARVGESLGVRCGEVRAAKLDGVPLAVVPVSRQVGQGIGTVSERLKTRWSARSLVVPGPMGARLSELASRGGEWLADCGLGLPMGQKQLARVWSDAVPEAIRHPPKNLRPSWQTFMRWDLRVPPELIEKMMGHVGDGVTGRHYDRPDEERFAEAVATAYARRPFADDWHVV